MEAEQICIFVFAFLSLGFAVYVYISEKKDSGVLSGAALASFVILALVGAVGSGTIKEIGFEIFKGKVNVKRNIPTESQNEQAIDMLVKGEERPSIAEEPLFKSAVQRRDEERSPTDFLLLAHNAWKEKQYEKGLEYAYAGLALKPEDKRIKAGLESLLGILFKEGVGADEQALRYFRQAIKTDPTFSWSHSTWAFYCTGRASPRKRRRNFERSLSSTRNMQTHITTWEIH